MRNGEKEDTFEEVLKYKLTQRHLDGSLTSEKNDLVMINDMNNTFHLIVACMTVNNTEI